jgi:uncharacterized protein YbjT (DUF2867 family)
MIDMMGQRRIEDMYLVMGITGRVGASVARHLLNKGKPVRALVRDRTKATDWERQGVELVEGDWLKPGMIASALEGVEGAYIMNPPIYMPSKDFRESRALIDAYVDALHAVRLPRLVVLSSNGADKATGLGAITPLSLLEAALRDLAYPHAFIRPGSFYENFLQNFKTAKSGIFSVFYAETAKRYPMTAIEDIGQLAALLLTGDTWSGRRIIELGTMVSPDELATAMGDVLGHAVAAQSIPRDTWAPLLDQMGFTESQTWAFEEIYDGVNSGWIGFGIEGTERVDGSTSAHDVFSAASRTMAT